MGCLPNHKLPEIPTNEICMRGLRGGQQGSREGFGTNAADVVSLVRIFQKGRILRNKVVLGFFFVLF